MHQSATRTHRTECRSLSEQQQLISVKDATQSEKKFILKFIAATSPSRFSITRWYVRDEDVAAMKK